MNFTPGMSNYAKRMIRLSARIFVDVPRPTSSKSMRVVKIFSERPMDLRPEIVDYYPPHEEFSGLIKVLREYGLFRNWLCILMETNAILPPKRNAEFYLTDFSYFFKDEHLDFKEEMVRRKILRGKIKPKRGEGKRSLLKDKI